MTITLSQVQQGAAATVPLPVSQGGTSATSAAAALASLGAQPSGNYATGGGTATGNNTGDQVLPTLASLGAQPSGNYATGGGTATGINTGDNAVNSLYSSLVNYTHPASHPPSIITQNSSNRFVTDAEKTAWNAKQDAGNYATGGGTATGTNTGDQTNISGNAATATALSVGADRTKLDSIATNATANTGTVSSVGASVPSFLSVTGSPVTTSGTLSISYSGSALPVANGGTGVTTLTGIVKASGTSAFSVATAGTDYLAPSGALGTPSSGTLTNCTKDGTNGVGYLNIPQNIQSAGYTFILADAGKHILHPSSDTTARTFVIPANVSVPYPIGTAITIINQFSAGIISISINSDVLRLAGAGTTGIRTLAANGIATAIKITATEWFISGTGLS